MLWDDPIRMHVPNLDRTDYPEKGQGDTISEALLHITRLGRPQTLIFGPHGAVTADEKTVVQILSKAPRIHRTTYKEENGEGQKEQNVAHKPDTNTFKNDDFIYNNLAYGAVALAVQNVSGQRYSDFIQSHILDPLGMDQTVLSADKLKSVQNTAHGYVKLENDEYHRLNTEDITDENHAIALAAGGVRSSINDLQKWALALLASYHADTPVNVLRQVTKILECPLDINERISYGFGYHKGYYPDTTVGEYGMNHRTENEEPDFFNAHRISIESSKRLFISHNGI